MCYLYLLIKTAEVYKTDVKVIKVVRNTAIVLLFLTGFNEINYQFRYYFPGVDLNVLYLQLYYFAFVLIFIWLNKKEATSEMSPGSRMALLVSCILFFIIALPVISQLQSQLLQEHKSVAYFNACWINATINGNYFI